MKKYFHKSKELVHKPKEWVISRFREVLSLEGSPNSLALGSAIGIFLAWLPLLGLEWFIVLAIIFFVKEKVNKATLLIGLIIRNPITTIPLSIIDYSVGRALVGGPEIVRISTPSDMIFLFKSIGYPLIVGSIVVGAFFALLA